MALERLTSDEVYRIGLAYEQNFANWQTPTAAEMNANSTNADPSALNFWLTCALNVDGTTFDLDESEKDDSLTFCQTAGTQSQLSRSATIVYQIEEAKSRWTDATSTLAVNGYNTATLAKSLLGWRGVPFFAWMSIGKASNEAFAVGDRVSLVEVSTDVLIPELSSGANVLHTQTFAKRSRILWNWELTA
jgi:hypothetical protein